MLSLRVRPHFTLPHPWLLASGVQVEGAAAEVPAAGQVTPDKAELTALFLSLKAANPEFGQKRLLVAVRLKGARGDAAHLGVQTGCPRDDGGCVVGSGHEAQAVRELCAQKIGLMHQPRPAISDTHWHDPHVVTTVHFCSSLYR